MPEARPVNKRKRDNVNKDQSEPEKRGREEGRKRVEQDVMFEQRVFVSFWSFEHEENSSAHFRTAGTRGPKQCRMRPEQVRCLPGGHPESQKGWEGVER